MQRWLAAFIPAAARCLRCSYLSCDVVSNFMVGSFAGIPFPPFRNNFHSVPYGPERIEYLDLTKSAHYDLTGGGWTAISTPGHTEDSLSFYNTSSRELICGDLILNQCRPWKGALNRFHWSEEAIKASFSLLKNALQPQVIYPGHGEVVRDPHNALQRVEVF